VIFFLSLNFALADALPEGRLRFRECRHLDAPLQVDATTQPAKAIVRRSAERPEGPMTAAGLARASLPETDGRVPSVLGLVQDLQAIQSVPSRLRRALDSLQEFYVQGMAFDQALRKGSTDRARRLADASQVSRVLRNVVRVAEALRTQEVDDLELEQPGKVQATSSTTDWTRDEAMVARLHRGLPDITDRPVAPPRQPTGGASDAGPGLEVRVVNCKRRPLQLWGEAWVLGNDVPQIVSFEVKVEGQSAHKLVIPSPSSGEVRLVWGSDRDDIDAALGDAFDLVVTR